jgi:ER-bound oxygenase mpaB/B'/Rubber oxygenase, catalytic domain
MSTDMEPYAPFALGPESVAWRIHASPVTLLGGIRALMMQALHPAAMAGVADHSSYQKDVWGRLNRTRDFVLGGLLATNAMAAGSALTKGDAAILRFLAAAEIIETDLWQQYNELGGVNGGNPAYMAALQNLDGDMPQYIADNTDDEMSHAAFLNAYLKSRGAEPVNLDRFRTLPSSKATGAKQIGRLTNLLKLDVDTSWYTRYRSEQNPDFGAQFPQAVTIRNEPGIPLSDTDTPPSQQQPVSPTTAQQRRMQAIANTAGFHFGYIEQGGSEPLHRPQPEGLRCGGPANRRQHRRSRSGSLRGLA